MESLPGRFQRLLLALEQLATRTASRLHIGDFTGAVDSLDRSESLVADLTATAEQLRQSGNFPAALLLRAQNLITRHVQISQSIAEHKSRIGEALDRDRRTLSQLRKIQPAYGRTLANSTTSARQSHLLESSG